MSGSAESAATMSIATAWLPFAPVRLGCLALIAACGGLAAAGEPAVLRPAAGRPLPTGRRPAKIDADVMPAGGTRSTRCSQCDRAACPHCRQVGGHAPHGTAHAQCQHGLCPAHCPVRPDVFGFYGTQWRRWPGSDVVPASATDAAAPARPARSQVPSAAEESLLREEAPPEPTAPDVAVPQDDAAPPAQEAPGPDQENVGPGREDAAANEPAARSRTAWRTFTAAAP